MNDKTRKKFILEFGNSSVISGMRSFRDSLYKALDLLNDENALNKKEST